MTKGDLLAAFERTAADPDSATAAMLLDEMQHRDWLNKAAEPLRPYDLDDDALGCLKITREGIRVATWGAVGK